MPVSAKFRAAQRAAAKARKQTAYRKTVIPRSLPQQVKTIMTRASEKKYIDYIPLDSTPASIFLIGSNLSNNDTMFCVNAMQQGTGFYNRIGRKTKTLSIRLKLQFLHNYSNNFTTPYSTGVNGNILRCVLLYDRENTGVIPTFAQIFGLTTQTGATVNTVTDPLQLTHSERYRVLMDKVVVMNPDITPVLGDYDPVSGNSTAAYTCQKRYFIDQYIDVSKQDIVQTYQSTSNPATVADFSSGAIYLVMKALDHQNGVNEIYNNMSTLRIKVSDM
uniref:Hypothetical capsid protein n=1 Tax=uncultured virus TaxID=340016 RepID=A0A1D8MK01_9VIRU|nr:hypothetical capsid protein [uncultured virus]